MSKQKQQKNNLQTMEMNVCCVLCVTLFAKFMRKCKNRCRGKNYAGWNGIRKSKIQKNKQIERVREMCKLCQVCRRKGLMNESGRNASRRTKTLKATG